MTTNGRFTHQNAEASLSLAGSLAKCTTGIQFLSGVGLVCHKILANLRERMNYIHAYFTSLAATGWRSEICTLTF